MTTTESLPAKETIVTSWLKVRNNGFKQHFEYVLTTTAKTLTLANKLGTFFLLERLESGSGDDIADLCGDEQFWRWCIACVTTEKGEMTQKPHVTYPPRTSKDVSRRKKETDADYEVRRKRYREEQCEERATKEAEGKNIKPKLEESWARLRTHLPKTFTFQPRDQLPYVYQTYVKQYVVNLRLGIATTLVALMNRVIKLQVSTDFQDLVFDTASDRTNVLGMIGQIILRTVQGYPTLSVQDDDPEIVAIEPAWRERRQALRAKYLDPSQHADVWTRIHKLVDWHTANVPDYQPSAKRTCGADYKGWGLAYLQAKAMKFLPYRYRLIKTLAAAGLRSYAIIPQMDPACRFLDVNRSTLRDLLMNAHHNRHLPVTSWFPDGGDDDDEHPTTSSRETLKLAIVSQPAWSRHVTDDVHIQFMKDLFRMPKLNTTQTFTGCLSTNLVQGNWHQKRLNPAAEAAASAVTAPVSPPPPPPPQPEPNDPIPMAVDDRPVVDMPPPPPPPPPPPRRRHPTRRADNDTVPIKPLSSLKTGHVHEHGKDFIIDPDIAANVAFADPGHANLLMCVFQPAGHADVDRTIKPYRLRNRQYRDMTGMNRAKRQREKIYAKHPLAEAAHKALSHASAKVLTSAAYIQHVQCLVHHWTELFHYAFLPEFRDIRMKGHGEKRRAIHKIVTDISSRFPRPLDSSSNSPAVPPVVPPVVLVIGNGCRSATSRGHDSAPNKLLRRELARHFIVLMSSEYLSSQRSPCCHAGVHHGKYDQGAPTRTGYDGQVHTRQGQEIRGMFHCDNKRCNRVFDRDVAAAHNIGAIFRHQVKARAATQLFASFSA